EDTRGSRRAALRRELVHGATLGAGGAPGAEPGQVAGERPLRHLETLTGEQRAEVLLRRHLPGADQPADGFPARLGGVLLLRPHPAVTSVPTPWSVKSSAMVAWATLPSSTWTRSTPPASARRMACTRGLFGVRTAPSASWCSRSCTVSWLRISPP